MKDITNDSKDVNISDSGFSTLDKHSELRHSIEGLNNRIGESNSEDEAPPAYTNANESATKALPAVGDHHRFHIRNPHLGREIKDRFTHTTHEQRELEREVEAVQRRAIREATEKAIATGEKQLVGKDSDGKDIYIEPPKPGQYYGAYGYGYGYGGYGFPPYYGYGLGLGLNPFLFGSPFGFGFY